MRRVVVVLVVMSAVLASGTAAEARGRPWQPPPPLPPLECGVLPDHDVRLTADLTCNEPFLSAEGGSPYFPSEWQDLRPTIDLGGHTLDIRPIAVNCFVKPTDLGPCGIVGPYRFVNGTLLGNVSNVASFDRVTIHGEAWVAEVPFGVAVPEFVMKNSAVVDGAIHTNRLSTIERSLFVRSRIDRGLYTWYGLSLAVRSSWFIDSPGPAAVAATSKHELGDVRATIEGNLFVRSQGPAVVLSTDVWGISRTDVPSTFVDNIVVGGHDDGISIHARWPLSTTPTIPPTAGPFTIAGNLTVANAGHGISVTIDHPAAQDRVVDGGGNRAFGNGLEPQCVGVVCSPTWWR